MREDREDRLRQRAYTIWESEGRPDGREGEHWAQAERELAAQPMAAEHPAAAAETGAVKKPRKRTATSPASSTTRRGKGKAAELRP